MKVVFLDIDGVLNTEPHMMELYKQWEAGKITRQEYFRLHDAPFEGTLLPLKKIVDATGAKIVLSSTWRSSPDRIAQLNKCFGELGFSIYDVTCKGVNHSRLKMCGFRPSNCYDSEWEGAHAIATYDRGAEIANYLFEHPEVESFVIIDDDSMDIKPYYPDRLVQTDFYSTGLDEKHADRAIAILNKRFR